MKEPVLTKEIRESVDSSVLCWLATSDDNGLPNVSPKEMFIAYDDDKFLIANIASPCSFRNIESNNLVCVSFIDVFKQKGFKLTGSASIVAKDNELYELYLAEIHKQLGGEAFPVKNVIEITVSNTAKIVAPSYLLFPETLERDQIESAMNTYGVKPI